MELCPGRTGVLAPVPGLAVVQACPPDLSFREVNASPDAPGLSDCGLALPPEDPIMPLLFPGVAGGLAGTAGLGWASFGGGLADFAFDLS